MESFGIQGRREQELNDYPKLKKYWKSLQKKDAKESEETKSKLDFERRFLKRLMQKFLNLLTTIQPEGNSVTHFTSVKNS